MGRFVGGRFGTVLGSRTSLGAAKGVFSISDNYYMNRDGGLRELITTINGLNSAVGWSYIPTVDYYTTTGNQGTDWNGSRFRITGNGILEFNDYEYPAYGKFDLRGGDTSKDCFIQLYGFNGTASNFTSSPGDGNLFQFGVYWEASANTDNLTNSLEATGAVAGGEAAYLVTAGYGNKQWGLYNGGASDNSEAQGTTNREEQKQVNWTGQQLTWVIYGQNAGASSRLVKLYMGETLIRTMTANVTAGRPVYAYFGFGYPSGGATAWTDGSPMFRYGNLSSGQIEL